MICPACDICGLLAGSLAGIGRAKPASMTTTRGPLTLETAGKPIKAWTRGVPFEDEAEAQLRRVASLPFIHQWVAVMPDVHAGIGATVGSVVATKGAVEKLQEALG